jgi:hypothetical protein
LHTQSCIGPAQIPQHDPFGHAAFPGDLFVGQFTVHMVEQRGPLPGWQGVDALPYGQRQSEFSHVCFHACLLCCDFKHRPQRIVGFFHAPQPLMYTICQIVERHLRRQHDPDDRPAFKPI